MKLIKAVYIILGISLCWLVNGYADRLYTWTDAKGVIHITQDPPPDTAKGVEITNYIPEPNQPVHRSTASNRPNQQQGNSNQGGGQVGSGVSTGVASKDANDNNEYYYTGDPYYRRTLRRYERRDERLDNNEPGKVGDLPERIQPGPRMR
jgi:Domain of unknown function (DUF4124)